MAEPLVQLVVNGGTGVLLAALGVTVLLGAPGREAKALGFLLGVMGFFFIGRHAQHVMPDPRDAFAINEAATIIHFLATPSLVLFASLSTGLHARAWSGGSRPIALLFAPFVVLLLLELAEDSLLPTLPFSPVAWERLFWTLSFVYATCAFALALRRESSPSAVPVRALLLAAIVAPMVHSVVGLFTEAPRWAFLSPLGIPPPPLLPAVASVQVPISVALSLVPGLLAARGAMLGQARQSAFAAASLAALVTALMAVGWNRPEGETDNLRWVAFAILLGYVALRHGYLGGRRVASPLVEWPLAAAAFALLLASFLATLALILPPAIAVGLALGLALLAAALVVALSLAPILVRSGDPTAEARYHEQREIGSGANGRVVLALDRRLHRDVVLKRLPRGERALAEARAASRVVHPSLVAVHDVVEDNAGTLLVLEHVPGGTLEDRVRKRALTSGEAKRIGAELASALAAVHEAGLIHGDIKATNVLLRADGTAALSDFGSARALPDVEATLHSFAAAPVSGSLAGAAPEVLEGAKPDPRADVYALGALLYRCLAGEAYIRFPPDAADAREAIRREPPRLPHPRVPPRWEALLTRCLAKDPAARPADGGAMRAAISGVEG